MVITDEQRKDSRKKLLFGGLIGCGALILIAILIPIILYFRVFGTPTLPKEFKQSEDALKTLQPAPMTLQQQVEAIQRASEARMQVPAQVIADQSDVNARLAQETSKQHAGDVSNVKAAFGQGTVAMTADAVWRGKPVHITARAEPFVENGVVHFKLLEANAGNVGVPEAARVKLQQRLDEATQKQWPGFYVNSLNVTPGRVTVNGVTMPQ